MMNNIEHITKIINIYVKKHSEVISSCTNIQTFSNVMVLLQDSFEEETSCKRIHKCKLTTAGIYSYLM
jgi:hypothetical protein